jgi:glutamate--cysteine ligase
VGWPTTDDLDYHLTTLFFEVRPRGFLELRAGEALPDPWRPAPVVLVTSLLYDPQACEAGLALLAPHRRRLVSLWQRAATVGVRDPELQGLACSLWEIALAGAERLPAGFLGGGALRVARDFVERYPVRGRMPADELELLQGLNPAWAVAWASCGQDRPG